MKKLVSILLFCAVLMISCLPAFAEAQSDYTYYPESEAYVGTWYVDDYILEIDHEDEDTALFDCVVTRYDMDGATGEQWIYPECAYDDVGCALSNVEISQKFDLTFEDGEIASSALTADSFAGAFRLNEDSTLTWIDFTKEPGAEEMAFEKVPEYVENPIADYEGTWIAGRATLTIESLDDVVYCTVEWGSSYAEFARREYDDCQYDEITGGLTTFETGVKSILTYSDDGEIASTVEEFNDGAASFVINEDGTLTWTDFKEAPGENEFVFEKVA